VATKEFQISNAAGNRFVQIRNSKEFDFLKSDIVIKVYTDNTKSIFIKNYYIGQLIPPNQWITSYFNLPVEFKNAWIVIDCKELSEEDTKYQFSQISRSYFL
jgi:hypothetical protein